MLAPTGNSVFRQRRAAGAAVNRSVGAKVCFGAPTDPARTAAALTATNLSEFVAGSSQGMNTVICHNGTQLSGGQRQPRAIARAGYNEVSVLILHDVTWALCN